MLNAGEVRVWRVRLDGPTPVGWPEPSASEELRAAGFHGEAARERYLRAHRALRFLLASATDAPLHFGAGEKGKPYLPAAPELKFSLSRSHGMALVAAALHVDVGVDVERVRPVPECEAIAERFFPPSEAAAFAAVPAACREREFFRRWTRVEAMLKARGMGLYGAGAEFDGEWTTEEIGGCEGYAAAIAAAAPGLRILVEDL